MTDSLPTTFTFNLNDGDLVVTAHLAKSAVDGTWGIERVDAYSATALLPDFLADWMAACGKMIATGPVPDLIGAHNARDTP